MQSRSHTSQQALRSSKLGSSISKSVSTDSTKSAATAVSDETADRDGRGGDRRDRQRDGVGLVVRVSGASLLDDEQLGGDGRVVY
jgi:hypothetical protein